MCVWLRMCVCACVAETQDSQRCSSGLSPKGWEPGELMGKCQSKSQKPWGFGVGRDKSGTWDTLLSHFSRVRLCATPSLGFSRQEHWSGLPFPSPMHKSEKWKWSHSIMSDSLQAHGLQPTRLLRPWDFPVLEWGAIAFSWDTLLDIK